MSRRDRYLVAAGVVLFVLGVFLFGMSVGVRYSRYFPGSDAPRAAEEVPATDSPADLPAGGLLQPSALPKSASGEGQDGVASAGETATPSVTPTPPSAFEEARLTTEETGGMLASQARSVELTVLSGVQWLGLGLYVSDSFEWAEEYAFVVACESSNRVDVVGGPNWNGTYDHGGPQLNDVWAERFDLERVKADPVYATESAYELWLDTGDWGPWEACRP